MKMSRRARRMAQHHRRHKAGSLNMVSLMDIFTILVFFLLVNASEVELITPPKSVELPESAAHARPEQALTITVSPIAVQLANRQVTTIDASTAADEGPLPALVNALSGQVGNVSEAGQRQVNVVADRSLDYRVIRRILQSCTAAGFEHVALAVLQAPDRLQEAGP